VHLMFNTHFKNNKALSITIPLHNAALLVSI
jgi:hypothetical protein